jgi:hypothetical protein
MERMSEDELDTIKQLGVVAANLARLTTVVKDSTDNWKA